MSFNVSQAAALAQWSEVNAVHHMNNAGSMLDVQRYSNAPYQQDCL